MTSLNQLETRYCDDSQSYVEVLRWKARVLELQGQYHDALRVLRVIDTIVIPEGQILGSHILMVCQLLRITSQVDQLISYCQHLDFSCSASESVSHLDWIIEYLSAQDNLQVSNTMRRVITNSVDQLGIGDIEALLRTYSMLDLVRMCVLVRDVANNRFDCLVDQIRGAAMLDNDVLRSATIRAYIQSETCPLFRRLAEEFLADQ
jgi:hypothetical protein